MKITKKEDHVLLQNIKGSYHLSLEDFNNLGEEKAIEFAEKEIKKKVDSGYYTHATIDFEQAKELGFCEYGIEDFCEKLKLDIDKTYKVEELNKLLTVDMFEKYTDECVKLFGKNTLKYLGGVEGVLNKDNINIVLRSELIPEKTLHRLAVKFAYSCLDHFEKQYPHDHRPRKAIEAKEAWIKGDITAKQLSAAAESAAESAVRSAAESAAESVAWSVARSAAWSAAAESAARSAARSVAWSVAESAESAEKERQVFIILEMLEKDGE